MAARSLSCLRDKRSELDESANISDGLVDEQLANIEETLMQNPNDVGCWVAKGYLLLWEKRKYEPALRCFDRAVELDPSDAGAWEWRGTVLYFLRRYEEASDSANQALKFDPNDAIAWSNRGVMLRELGRYAEALIHFEHALELDPQYDEARNVLSSLPTYVEDGFLDAIGQNKLENARTIWSILHTATALGDGNRILKRCILFAAELGHLSFARELIGEAALQEEFFPLDRALEYLQSEDEALIEKLSPEIKEPVNVIVNDLHDSLQQDRKSETHLLAKVKSFSMNDDYVAKRGHLVHKLKAKDSTGRWAYYFVFVPKFVEQAFLDVLKSEKSIDLEDYGRVVASYYGEKPNEYVKFLLKEKYGFSV